MKTAVSIPDEIFEKADQLARKVRKSRSQLYTDAVREYVAKYATESVTETMTRICNELGDTSDPMISSVSRRTLERSEW
jgi:metal-responsive CopG/Arc/MetJ family transcriptional regulator